MKSFLLYLVPACACAVLVAHGQNPGPATAGPYSPPGPSPAASASTGGTNSGASASSVPLPGQPAGPVLEKNLPLIPQNVPASEKPGKPRRARASASPGASPTDTFGVEQDIRLHIRIRQAQTLAQNDPGVRADWLAVYRTRTDPARRAALKVYYNHLYARMVQIDPSIATLANARRDGSIDRMYNVRLGDVLPTEDPFATPAPDAGSGKNPPAAEDPPLPQ